MSKQPEKRNPYTTVVIDQEPSPAASAPPAPAPPVPPTAPPARPRGLRLLMAAGFASGGLAIALLLAFFSGRLGGTPAEHSAPLAVAQPATSAPAALPTSAPATALPGTALPATARPAQAAPATVAAPAPAPGIEIGADGSAWLFDAAEIELVAGEAAAITFINRAKRERHNWVLVAGDEALTSAVVAAAAQAGEAQGYLPADRASIIAASPLVAGGARATVEFTAPAPGEYTFLCTVPGHFETGMHGRLMVRAAGS